MESFFFDSTYPDVTEFYHSKRLLEHLIAWQSHSISEQHHKKVYSQILLRRNQSLKQLIFGSLASLFGQESYHTADEKDPALYEDESSSHVDLAWKDSGKEIQHLGIRAQPLSPEWDASLSVISFKISMEVLRTMLEGWKSFAEAEVLTPSSMPIMKFEDHSHEERKVVELVQDVAKMFILQWHNTADLTITSARKRVIFEMFRHTLPSQSKHCNVTAAISILKVYFGSWFTYVSHILPERDGAIALTIAAARMRSSRTFTAWKVRATRKQMHSDAFNHLFSWANDQRLRSHFCLWKEILLISCAEEMYFHLFAFRFFYPWFDYAGGKLSAYRLKLDGLDKLLSHFVQIRIRNMDCVLWHLKDLIKASVHLSSIQRTGLLTFFHSWQLYLADVYYFHNHEIVLGMQVQKNELRRLFTTWRDISSYFHNFNQLQREYLRCALQKRLQTHARQWQLCAKKRKLIRDLFLEFTNRNLRKRKAIAYVALFGHARANAHWQTRCAQKVVPCWRQAAKKKRYMRLAMTDISEKLHWLLVGYAFRLWCHYSQIRCHYDGVLEKLYVTRQLNLKRYHFWTLKYACANQKYAQAQKVASVTACGLWHLKRAYFHWVTFATSSQVLRQAQHVLQTQCRKAMTGRHFLSWKYALFFRALEREWWTKIIQRCIGEWKQLVHFSKLSKTSLNWFSCLRWAMRYWALRQKEKAFRQSKSKHATVKGESLIKAKFFRLFCLYSRSALILFKVRYLRIRKVLYRTNKRWRTVIEFKQQHDAIQNVICLRQMGSTLRQAFQIMKSKYIRRKAIRLVLHQIGIFMSSHMLCQCFQAMRALIEARMQSTFQNICQALALWRRRLLQKRSVAVRKVKCHLCVIEAFQLSSHQLVRHFFLVWCVFVRRQRMLSTVVADLRSKYDSGLRTAAWQRWTKRSIQFQTVRQISSSKGLEKQRMIMTYVLQSWKGDCNHARCYKELRSTRKKQLLSSLLVKWNAYSHYAGKLEERCNSFSHRRSTSQIYKILSAWLQFRLKATRASTLFTHSLLKYFFRMWRFVTADQKENHIKIINVSIKRRQVTLSQILSSWTRRAKVKMLSHKWTLLTFYAVYTKRAFLSWLKRIKHINRLSAAYKRVKMLDERICQFKALQVLNLYFRNKLVKKKINAEHLRRSQIRILQFWSRAASERRHLQKLYQDVSWLSCKYCLHQAFLTLKSMYVKGHAVRSILRQIDFLNSRYILRKCFLAMRRLIKAHVRSTCHNVAQTLELWRGTNLRKRLESMQKVGFHLMLMNKRQALYEIVGLEILSSWFLIAQARTVKKKMHIIVSNRHAAMQIRTTFQSWSNCFFWLKSLYIREDDLSVKCNRNILLMHLEQWSIWSVHLAKSDFLSHRKRERFASELLSEWQYAAKGNNIAAIFELRHKETKLRRILPLWQRYCECRRWKQSLSVNARAFDANRIICTIWAYWKKLLDLGILENSIQLRTMKVAWMLWYHRFETCTQIKSKIRNFKLCRGKRFLRDLLTFWLQMARQITLVANIVVFMSEKRNQRYILRVLSQWHLASRFESKLFEACVSFSSSIGLNRTRGLLLAWRIWSINEKISQKHLRTKQEHRNFLIAFHIFQSYRTFVKSWKSYRIRIELHSYTVWKTFAGMRIFWRSMGRQIFDFHLAWMGLQILQGWNHVVQCKKEMRQSLKGLRCILRLVHHCFHSWHTLASTAAFLKQRGAWFVVVRNAKIAGLVLGQWVNLLNRSRSIQKYRAISLLEPLAQQSIHL